LEKQKDERPTFSIRQQRILRNLLKKNPFPPITISRWFEVGVKDLIFVKGNKRNAAACFLISHLTRRVLAVYWHYEFGEAEPGYL